MSRRLVVVKRWTWFARIAFGAPFVIVGWMFAHEFWDDRRHGAERLAEARARYMADMDALYRRGPS